MNSESTIFSQNIDSVKSIRPTAKSFSLDTRSSDSDAISRDNSKRFQDSDSLKLSSSLDSEKVTKNMKREELPTQFYLTFMLQAPTPYC